jgi:hypothetical protein
MIGILLKGEYFFRFYFIIIIIIIIIIICLTRNNYDDTFFCLNLLFKLLIIAFRKIDYCIGRCTVEDEAFEFGDEFLYNFIAYNGAQIQALPLSIQHELMKKGTPGTLGAILNISYENATADIGYYATVSTDYIITAAPFLSKTRARPF